MESPESWFHRRATLYVEAQILFHLNQVGVWKLLKQGGSHTAPQIAGSLQLDPVATDTLLDYVLHVDDLLERDQENRYSLSEFGRKVVDRYSDGKSAAAEESINMFDVRVGAYGPVWQNLGRMLSGNGRYGEHFHREGRYAEDGVFKLAMRFFGSLVEHVDELAVDRIVEVGLTTGLIEKLSERYPAHCLYGLDRSRSIVDRAIDSAASKDLSNIEWIHSDYYDVAQWAGAVDSTRPGLIFSLHFHELMAGGEERFVESLQALKAALPHWSLLAFEQPRLPQSDRATTPETLWLYSQSNILIHHLIGNGRILSRETWIELGARAGCRVSDRPCEYLGYRAFLFQW